MEEVLDEVYEMRLNSQSESSDLLEHMKKIMCTEANSKKIKQMFQGIDESPEEPSLKESNEKIPQIDEKNEILINKLKDKIISLFGGEENDGLGKEKKKEEKDDEIAEYDVKVMINLAQLNRKENKPKQIEMEDESSTPVSAFKTDKSDDMTKNSIMEFIRKTKNMKEMEIRPLVKKKAEQLGLFPYELMIYVTAYQIANQIEEMIPRKKMAGPEKNELIFDQLGKSMMNYLSRNKKEKWYKLIKMTQTIFRHFDMNENKAQRWLTYILNENSGKSCLANFWFSEKVQKIDETEIGNLKRSLVRELFSKAGFEGRSRKRFVRGRSPSPSYVKIKKEPLSKPEKKELKRERKKKEKVTYEFRDRPKGQSSQSSDRQVRSKKKGLVLKGENLEFEKQEDDHDHGALENDYPLPFQKRLSRKLDKMLEGKMREVMRQKSEQTCIPETLLRRIYSDHGQYSLNKKIQKNSKPTRLINNNFLPNFNPVEHEKKPEPEDRLELKLVEHLKKFPEATQNEIFYEAKYLMKELKISQCWLTDDEELHYWIQDIYKKYGMNGMMERRMIKDERMGPGRKSFVIEIPKTSPRDRPPGLGIRKYH